MTSQRQRSQDWYDHILPFIQEAADEFYGGNLDRGFRHWAFATIFAVGHDVQGNDVVEYTAIDGADDFEIDGYFVPESDDDSVVHLFQSKHRQPGTSMGPRELSTFLNAPNRILNANEVAASRNEETKNLHDELLKRLQMPNRQCSINLVWATSGRLTPAARRNAEESRSRKLTVDIGGNPIEVMVTLECLDLEDLHEQHEEQRTSDEVSNCDFEFQLEPDSYHQTGTGAEYRTLYMTVSVKQIIEVFARHSYKIFRLNPRGPLGNKVNAAIKRTLLDQIDRQRFHLLNNGITAICASYRLAGENLSVRDFQIINGCQTTVTLWDARAAVKNDPQVQVTVKLTECPEHFVSRIAETTNSQTALRAEDFTSNEPVQVRLQSQFRAMSPPWFYQIKRGEWGKTLGGPSEKEIYRDPAGGYRYITSKDVAQAVVAFAGFPGEAKDSIRKFLNKEVLMSVARESEIRYEHIYTEHLNAAQLLLPALIQRKVRKKVNEDKERYEWLDYARFHIIWLIGEILREHYEVDGNLFTQDRALRVTLSADDWFEHIYNIALISIDNFVQGLHDSGEFRGYRELFRTPINYRQIQSNVLSAIRLSQSFGNPMEHLPA